MTALHAILGALPTQDTPTVFFVSSYGSVCVRYASDDKHSAYFLEMVVTSVRVSVCVSVSAYGSVFVLRIRRHAFRALFGNGDNVRVCQCVCQRVWGSVRVSECVP